MEYKVIIQIESEDGRIILNDEQPISATSTEMLEMNLLKYQSIIEQDEEKINEENEEA